MSTEVLKSNAVSREGQEELKEDYQSFTRPRFGLALGNLFGGAVNAD